MNGLTPIDYIDRAGNEHGVRKHLDQHWHVKVYGNGRFIKFSSPQPVPELAQARLDHLAARYGWEEVAGE
jgi:hypothetical protein